MSKDKTIPLDFWLGYTVEEMKSLPDISPIHVHEGVNIKIHLGPHMGGWELGPNGPRVVWFAFLTNGVIERFNSALEN